MKHASDVARLLRENVVQGARVEEERGSGGEMYREFFCGFFFGGR